MLEIQHVQMMNPTRQELFRRECSGGMLGESGLSVLFCQPTCRSKPAFDQNILTAVDQPPMYFPALLTMGQLGVQFNYQDLLRRHGHRHPDENVSSGPAQGLMHPQTATFGSKP